MLLAIDVGNTNIVAALYDEDGLKRSWRMATDINKASDEYGIMLTQFLLNENVFPDDIDDVMIASVVPNVMHSLNNAVRRYLNCTPMVVGPGIKTGMNIRMDNPRELGADRIVNAVAAINKYTPPLIIVDFGTATTFCTVDKNSNYVGGVIVAGIKISMDALFEKTAKLPKVEIVAPPSTIGKNTVHSIQSGAVFGHAAQTDGIIRRIKREIGEEATVVATGGLAKTISKESEEIDIVDSMLTLDGLKILYDKNKER
ncbi:MAG TPA: type III pantothenate kinase [Candidatus Monoglobus merdigallinarum]|uniref:Type III pantothenate kinase n=1 Tax=Candidatus Monoglobus merdigallinarum TaxID=2838698 RepID=A0A9D1PQH9_9FIRM|nr:type III pantothenate kinase [Candidatus Monoglobus merdigallinarum]